VGNGLPFFCRVPDPPDSFIKIKNPNPTCFPYPSYFFSLSHFLPPHSLTSHGQAAGLIGDLSPKSLISHTRLNYPYWRANIGQLGFLNFSQTNPHSPFSYINTPFHHFQGQTTIRKTLEPFEIIFLNTMALRSQILNTLS
jgi:hypothetical protein